MFALPELRAELQDTYLNFKNIKRENIKRLLTFDINSKNYMFFRRRLNIYFVINSNFINIIRQNI